MTIEQYGITLSRIGKEDIELIRYWRNHPDLKNFFAYRRYISSRMQEKWFASVNNAHNYFFIISYLNEKIGVINCKNADPVNMIGEGGIFIWDKKYRESEIPVFATLCLIDTIFYHLKISNKSMVRILRGNERAIRYNRMLGYSLLPGQESLRLQYYILTKEDYEIKSARLRRAAQLATGDNLPPRIKGEINNRNLEAINNYFRTKNK